MRPTPARNAQAAVAMAVAWKLLICQEIFTGARLHGAPVVHGAGWSWTRTEGSSQRQRVDSFFFTWSE